MHWRWLIPLPLAAFLCGEAVHAPRLKPELPMADECEAYAEAREKYLLAYGFAKERKLKARELAGESLRLNGKCPGSAAEMLRTRAEELILKLTESP